MLPSIAALIPDVAKTIFDLIKGKSESEEKASIQAHEIAKMVLEHSWEIQQAQIDINKEEAKSRRLFIAGWRPFVGWICSFALAWVFFVKPFMVVIMPETHFPNTDIQVLMPILLGMLGLRSFEKVKGIDTK